MYIKLDERDYITTIVMDKNSISSDIELIEIQEELKEIPYIEGKIGYYKYNRDSQTIEIIYEDLPKIEEIQQVKQPVTLNELNSKIEDLTLLILAQQGVIQL